MTFSSLLIFLSLLSVSFSHSAVIDRTGKVLIDEKGNLVDEAETAHPETDDFVMIDEVPLVKAFQTIGWNQETISAVMALSPTNRLLYLSEHSELPGYKTPRASLSYSIHRKEHPFCDHFDTIQTEPQTAHQFEKWLQRKYPPLPDGSPSYQKADNSLSLPSFEFQPWGSPTNALVSFVFTTVAPEYLSPNFSDKKSGLIQELKRIMKKMWQGEVADVFLPTRNNYVIHLHKKEAQKIDITVVGILSRLDEKGQDREKREMQDFVTDKIYPLMSAGLKNFLINDLRQSVSDFHPPLRRPQVFVWILLRGDKCAGLPVGLISLLLEGLREGELNAVSDTVIRTHMAAMRRA